MDAVGKEIESIVLVIIGRVEDWQRVDVDLADMLLPCEVRESVPLTAPVDARREVVTGWRRYVN